MQRAVESGVWFIINYECANKLTISSPARGLVVNFRKRTSAGMVSLVYGPDYWICFVSRARL